MTPLESLVPPPIVNREEEIGEALGILRRLLDGLTVPEAVLYVCGVSEIGKTTLLNEIRRRAVGMGVPTAGLDFDPAWLAGTPLSAANTPWQLGVAVAAHLMDELERSADFVPRRRVGLDLSPDDAAERFHEFVDDLYRYSRQRPMVLFFDTLEACDRRAFHWVQERLLEPLLNRNRALVVLAASRIQPNTGTFDLIYAIERRTRILPLQPFGSSETERQLAILGATDVPLRGEELVRYTGGLPGLNRGAAEWQHQKKPPEELLDHLVHDIIFKRLAPYNVAAVERELLTVSVLRQFDSGLLEQLMNKLLPEKYPPDGGFRQVRRLLRALQETTLVEPHPDGYGYAVPLDVRLVLDRYWRQEQPHEHLRTHQIAEHWYADQIAQGDFVAIADRLYHRAGQWRDAEVNASLRDRVDLPAPAERLEILSRELRTTLDQLREKPRAFDLATRIRRVFWKEMKAFNQLLPEATVDDLIEQCRAFTEALT